MTVTDTDVHFMRLALAEAPKGNASPNPHVGAVVVSEGGHIVGRGFHPERGREHAEVAALRVAGDRARGGTLYVTLEPCNHHGRTPPCTDAIIAAGISRVVVAIRDPNPHVVGGGNARLREAGIEVTEGVEEAAAERVIAPWAKHVKTGKPFMRLKLATSLDGRIASATGVSKWITGPAMRKRVHAIRATVDAVVVGIGTALADDPALTPRDVEPIEGRAAPLRVVIDSTARLPDHAQLVRTARTHPTLVVTSETSNVDALVAHGVRIARVGQGQGGLDLAAAFAAIGKLEVVDLLVEGGARLAGQLIAQNLVDELHWMVAPIALGDRGAASLVGLSPASPDYAPRYRLDRLDHEGDDVWLVFKK
ncbi:MAG: bifunctional diaminohydroxyphosphoribosylaminopyrimidine deaminase/5-amino-6-(5-phosphoribosylamino)uracil reductase RibD [Polyangiales bacterium]